MALVTRIRGAIANPALLSTLQFRCFTQEASQLATSESSSLSGTPSQAGAPETSFAGVYTLDNLPLPRPIATQQKIKRQPISLEEAIKQVKAASRASFDETIELAVNLGTDPRRGDQMVRGATMLPHGTGKTVRVCVFATGEAAQEAKAAGADIVGGEDLISDIQQSGGSGLQFDKCIATPAMMPKLGKVARILGPRGLMPNPKLGTVTQNITEAVAQVKRGRVEFRADKSAIVHAGIGKCSFADEALYANIGALASALLGARPKGVKGSGAGGYMLKAALSSTMGPGIPVSLASLIQAGQAAKKQ